MISEQTRQFVQLAFSAQKILEVWGARLEAVEPGIAHIVMPVTEPLTTFNGALIGGVIATLNDVAAGLALIAHLSEPRPVITLDFTSQHLAPAIGDTLIAVGQAERAGRAIGFASAQAFIEKAGVRTRVARLSATFSIAG